MHKVTSIRKQKGSYYQAIFDSGEKIRLSEDLLVRFRLLKGSELSEEELTQIKREADCDYGLQEALNYISYQLRSEKEVRIYLKNKEVPSNDHYKIIQRLKELKVLDDEVYAASFVRTQMRLSDKGPGNIEQELKKRGIQADIMNTALALYLPEVQLENAIKAAQKVIRQTHGKSYRESLQKVRLNLLKKGHYPEIVQQAMDQLDFEKDDEYEWEVLQKEGQKILRRDHSQDLLKRKMKLKQKLYQKGFAGELIQRFIDEEVFDEE